MDYITSDRVCFFALVNCPAFLDNPFLRRMNMQKMMTYVLAVTISLISFSAMAMHCPDDMKRIDEELSANPPITAEQMETVKKLRAEGEVLHKGGKHEESVKVLAKAMEIMGIVRP
jgi:uncharacterized protein YneF (UPF0154 family)